jgi:hypothetical protein
MGDTPLQRPAEVGPEGERIPHSDDEISVAARAACLIRRSTE